MAKEVLIGDNKFVWDGKVVKIYNVTQPNHELILTKDELKEVIAMNEFMAGMGDFYEH